MKVLILAAGRGTRISRYLSGKPKCTVDIGGGQCLIEYTIDLLHSRGIQDIGIVLGYEAQVRARSGLALKQGIGVLNGPGTIDSDYRGEVGVILFSFSDKDFTIRRGDRIAQMVFSRFERVTWEVVEELSASERGAGGFGHTGGRSGA